MPSASFYSALPALSASLYDTQRVVFHCQLSQQRGPSCANVYYRHALMNLGSTGSNNNVNSVKLRPDQEIYVLDGGFNEWARMYGRDSRYTEGFQASIYQDE